MIVALRKWKEEYYTLISVLKPCKIKAERS